MFGPKKFAGGLPWLLLIGGMVGVIASILLSVEVYNRLKNPAYVPVCNLNPVLSCTSVADSSASHLFGFPNYFIGIAGYGAVAAIGAGMLAGAQFKRWFWRLVQLGVTLAFAFVIWLQWQSLYRIGALCIFCMVIWAVTIPMFWYTTLYNLAKGNIKVSKRLQLLSNFAQKHHGDILLAWFLIILVLIGRRFWYYWQTLI